MRIVGIENLNLSDIDARLDRGGRFVCYPYCISLVIVTIRQASSIFLLEPGERGVLRGLPFVMISLFFGWWGVPWGVWYTLSAVCLNLGGGQDVTDEVRQFLQEATSEDAPVQAELSSCDGKVV
jgi:hypothetical protein